MDAGRTTREALDGEAFAALGAACVDHGTTTTGLHTDEEAVCAGAANLGRLVGAFHGGRLLKSGKPAIIANKTKARQALGGRCARFT